MNLYIYSCLPSGKNKQPTRALWVGLRMVTSSVPVPQPERLQQLKGHKNGDKRGGYGHSCAGCCDVNLQK